MFHAGFSSSILSVGPCVPQKRLQHQHYICIVVPHGLTRSPSFTLFYFIPSVDNVDGLPFDISKLSFQFWTNSGQATHFHCTQLLQKFALPLEGLTQGPSSPAREVVTMHTNVSFQIRCVFIHRIILYQVVFRW